MAIVNEITLLSILMALAKKYPFGAGGRVIVKELRVDKDEAGKCFFYLLDKKYIAATLGLEPTEVLDDFTNPLDLEYRLSGTGVDYLNEYRKELKEILEEINRKRIGFKDKD